MTRPVNYSRYPCSPEMFRSPGPTKKPTIEELQAAYRARPYVVNLIDDYYSGSQRFETEVQAVQYVAQQAARIAKEIPKGYRFSRTISRWSFQAKLTGPGVNRSWDLLDVANLS